MTAGAVVTDYEYNSANLIEKETLNVDGQSFVLDYVYNSTGNLTNTIYPSGANISYVPNALDQAKQAGSYATNATYHANGMPKSHGYGNGFAHASTQYNSGLPNTFYDKKSTTYALNHGFTYDANNNVTFLDDKVNNAYDLQMTFDGLDRLNFINDSYSGTGDVNYDTLGNITYYKIGSQTITYHYNSDKQLDYTSGSKSYSFSYDDKGNVTDNGTRSFEYNTANQMVDSDGYEYTYDGNNKRVMEDGSSGTASYSFYGSNGKLMYRKVNSQHIDYYYLGEKLVANKKGNTVTYLHSDFLGSTAAESNTSGTVTDRLHYQPFGESIETPKDDIGYTGHKFDTDLGLSYMQARYYDPVIGRFYSNDPVGVRDVHSFNRYAYANNNPYKYIDPDGNESRMAVSAGHDSRSVGKIGRGELSNRMSARSVAARTSLRSTPVGRMVNAVLSVANIALNAESGETDASTPTGSRDNPMDVEDGTNEPTEIDGREFSGHALDRMQGRGVPPTAVEEAIGNGVEAEGNTPGSTTHTDSQNGVKVVTNETGKVVTVINVGRDK